MIYNQYSPYITDVTKGPVMLDLVERVAKYYNVTL